jgi:hypothetical protein
MLSVNTYPKDFIEGCRAQVAQQLEAYDTLLHAAEQSGDAPTQAALQAFEPLFFNNLVLVLDNMFLHRSRMLERKDGNPMNEVRVLCQSILNNDSRLGADKTIKLDATRSVLGHKIGDAIGLTASAFRRLSEAYFGEIERTYGEAVTA